MHNVVGGGEDRGAVPARTERGRSLSRKAPKSVYFIKSKTENMDFTNWGENDFRTVIIGQRKMQFYINNQILHTQQKNIFK